MSNPPTIAIVGRPNVGKSSLFNLLVGRRISIVHEESGVTRDRVTMLARVGVRHAQLVDTGGLGVYSGEKSGTSLWDGLIRSQVDAALECSDLVLCVVDVTAGPTPLDKDVVNYLRRDGRRFLLVANKVDSEAREASVAEFAELGVDKILPVSCVHRRGIRDLVDAISAELGSGPEDGLSFERPLAIAVVGRPNVGKSSFVNRLVGEERVLVSDIAGTTRDAIDVPFEIRVSKRKKRGGEAIPAVLIDTAGLRKRGRADTAVEFFSIKRAESAVKRCDVAVIIVEAAGNGVTAQDKRIAKIVDAAGKGCIIVANKWDLVEGGDKREVIDEIRRSIPFLSHAPLVLTSALTGAGFDRVGGELAALKRRIESKVPTSIVNRIIQDAAASVSPPVVRGKTFKVYYATMTSTAPAEFLLFVNDPKLCTANYLAYLRNSLRGKLDLCGLPIVLKMEKRLRRD